MIVATIDTVLEQQEVQDLQGHRKTKGNDAIPLGASSVAGCRAPLLIVATVDTALTATGYTEKVQLLASRSNHSCKARAEAIHAARRGSMEGRRRDMGASEDGLCVTYILKDLLSGFVRPQSSLQIDLCPFRRLPLWHKTPSDKLNTLRG